MLTNFLKLFKSKLHTSFNYQDRRAKIQDSDFIIAFLQALSKAKKSFSLAELQQSVSLFMGVKIGCSAFNERLKTLSLVKNLETSLSILMTMLFSENSSHADLLKKIDVVEIIGVDSSMVSLWDGLARHFKGTFMKASVKLHMSINLLVGHQKWFKITEGATHDSKRFPDIVAKTLYVFDLGYLSGKLLHKISEQKAFFLSRIKSNTYILITNVIDGINKSIKGHNLVEYPIEKRGKKIVELEGVMVVKKKKRLVRVVGFWHKKEKNYRWYITNLKCPRTYIYEIYRLRWQIELSFKAMKSTLNFDRMPTLNHNTIISFILASQINYLFSMIIREEGKKEAIKKNHKAPNSVSIQRSAKVFYQISHCIFDLFKLGKRLTSNAIEKLMKNLLLLLTEILDPNHNKRKTTAMRLGNIG